MSCARRSGAALRSATGVGTKPPSHFDSSASGSGRVRWAIAPPALPITDARQALSRATIPLMSDKKPTLEYGRPGTLPKGWVIDIAVFVVLTPIGLICRGATAFWIWKNLPFEDLHDIGTDLLQALISTIGLVLLFMAWQILQRIRRG